MSGDDLVRISIGQAYSRTGAAWDRGPSRIYGRLAHELIAHLPGGVAGRAVLDVGAGTGAATSAAVAAGASSVVAADIAEGALRTLGSSRRRVAADACSLPFTDASFDAVVAAFSLNHLDDPARAACEARRVLRPDGALAASAYGSDDRHPVKRAVEEACTARGWTAPDWYRRVQRDAMSLLADPNRAVTVLGQALPGVRAEVVRVAFPELDRRQLVEWRLGMAQIAPFVATLEPSARDEIVAEAIAAIDDEPLVRPMVVITWLAAW